MIEKAKQANRYGVNSKLATAAKIREMLLSDEFLDALAKRISYKSGIWIPKVGDKVKVNCPGRIAHGKVGVIVEDAAAEYVVRVDSENLTSRNLKCEDLEPVGAEAANPSETPNSSSPDPGPGYRLLSKDPPEQVVNGDEFFSDYKWLESGGRVHADGLQGPYYYRRKINDAEEGRFEDSIVEPEKESDWQPTPNEWVQLPDGTVRQHNGYEIHGTKKYYRFEGINSRFELGTLKPWEPKVRDKVLVNHRGKIVHGLECVIIEAVNGNYTVDRLGLISKNLKAEHLEPIVASQADHIADAKRKVPPTGYRLLDKSAKVEPRKAGDLFWSLTLADWKTISAEGEQDANRDDWPACRKIEKPAKAPEPQYREPTYADLANGPIEVEVCYDNTLETSWGKRMLYAVLPANVILRFVCEDPDVPESIYRWKHARVRVR